MQPPTSIPFVDMKHAWEVIREPFLVDFHRIMDSSRYLGGLYAEELGRSFARYVTTRFAVSCASGTAGLTLSLGFWAYQGRINPGDEVITQANSFIATAEAISHVGAVPVFVDVDPRTRQLTPDGLVKGMSPRTRAVLPVHLYGIPNRTINEIVRFARGHGLLVLEDCCQAHGATVSGRRVGSFGDASVFSFYPSKNLGGCGDGGIVCTNDEELATYIKRASFHGESAKNIHAHLGGTHRMDEITAAFLLHKLPHLDSWNQRRRVAAACYCRRLGICFDPCAVYHVFSVDSPNRAALAELLREAGIETGCHYPTAIFDQPAYRNRPHRVAGTVEVTRRHCASCISLPMHPFLANEQVEYVCDRLLGSGLQPANYGPQ